MVPPNGPVLGSRRDRSASSRRGYIKRVRYEADCGRAALLGLSRVLLRLFCAAVVLMGLVTPAELRFLLPDLDDGLYAQGAPFARQRPHNGRALLHLTLGMRQVSQVSVRWGGWGGGRGRSDCSGMSVVGIGAWSDDGRVYLEQAGALEEKMMYRARAPGGAEKES